MARAAANRTKAASTRRRTSDGPARKRVPQEYRVRVSWKRNRTSVGEWADRDNVLRQAQRISKDQACVGTKIEQRDMVCVRN